MTTQALLGRDALPESQQRGHIGQNSISPSRVSLVGDHHALLIQRDGIVQNIVVVILIRGCEMVLKESTACMLVSLGNSIGLLEHKMGQRLHTNTRTRH